MIRDIEDRLGRMGLSKSPFLSYDPQSPDFSKIFVNRTKELYKIDLALDYYKSQSNQNIAFIGPSRIGKTTLLRYTIMRISGTFRCLYFEYPLRFNEFCQKSLDFFGPERTSEISITDSRELGNLLIQKSDSSERDTIIIIDNFEEMIHIPEEEVEGFIRIFRRAKCLFILACTEREWTQLLMRHQKLKYAFTEEIYIPPFSLKHCMEFFQTRVAVARKGDLPGILPFTDEAAKIIGIYSCFIPGRMNDMANKILFEALTEEIETIYPEFVRALIFQTPVLGPYLAGLNENEIRSFEIMIEQNKPLSFEDLADSLGVSRVAAASYLQKLIERKIVLKMDSPGKKRLFQITDTFRGVLV
jgi:hypothetical protein